ncbi:LacI family DNA-binding transcriptional regulator [Rhodococcus tibetensis]|uniref:LacI family transcriptional regulator n=1 Tax=Rhodococcus tibetensis TaxID=2965064 RepID=A0ABT1Q927_9NOCA|nr:LacI family DNA-binding transcriptional regulator [Rhodococcus sp. FXJ9.536]MCQ4118747.1 LacI family transcriptional regulator [Rhodococcus sp. FXJ9.536]
MPEGRAAVEVGTEGPVTGPHRRPTMADVANRAGVSRTLVSLIFSNKPGASDETRERVLQAADEIGYRLDRAARMLARGRSRTLGVLIDVQQPFQADLIGTIYAEAEAAGYEVLLSASAPNRDERKAIEALLSHRCEGLILLGPLAEASFIRTLANRAVVTVVGRALPHSSVDTVRTADAKGIRQSVDHLVELGHQDIAHVDGGADPGSPERRRAYVAAMRKHGLSAHQRVIPGRHTEDAGVTAAKILMSENRLPTAVLAGNDRCAIGLMDAFTRAHVDVPGDISIVGYDDSHLSQLSRIDLTTVRQDSDGLARHAVQFAVGRLEDETIEPQDFVIEPHLVVRGTSGPVRA